MSGNPPEFPILTTRWGIPGLVLGPFRDHLAHPSQNRDLRKGSSAPKSAPQSFDQLWTWQQRSRLIFLRAKRPRVRLENAKNFALTRHHTRRGKVSTFRGACEAVQDSMCAECDLECRMPCSFGGGCGV